MKRLVIYLTVCALLLCITTCTTPDKASTPDSPETPETPQTQPMTEPPAFTGHMSWLNPPDVMPVEPDSPVLLDGFEIVGVEGGGVRMTPDRHWDDPLEAELVVIGEYIGETSASYQYVHEMTIMRGGTYKQLKVLEVFRGDVEVGDIIPICQKYWIDAKKNILTTYHPNMTPMHNGDRWLHLLNYSEQYEAYENTGGGFGRYPLPNAEMMRLIDSVQDEFAVLKSDFYDWRFGEKSEYSQEDYAVAIVRFNEIIEETDFSRADLGVFLGYESVMREKYSFPWSFYFIILDKFGIGEYNWENPGKEIDRQLIDMVLWQQEMSRRDFIAQTEEQD